MLSCKKFFILLIFSIMNIHVFSDCFVSSVIKVSYVKITDHLVFFLYSILLYIIKKPKTVI